MISFSPITSAAKAADRRFTLVRSMGMAARLKANRPAFHFRSKK